jgi:SAM-dependent methyltransferase
MNADDRDSAGSGQGVRRMLGSLRERVNAVRSAVADVGRRNEELSARLDQLARQTERLEAYQHVMREEVEAAFASVTTALSGSSPDQPPGEILQRRLDHALLHAEALTAETRSKFERELAELRSTLRLTQAMAERAAAAPSGTAPAPGRGDEGPPLSGRSWTHPAPSFSALYRAFEDAHRGDPVAIRHQQRADYLEVVSNLPNPELPVADLGCGRGEFVELLVGEGVLAVGVDSNLGQVVGGDRERFVEQDLFEWLDEREGESLRAVLALHVVEHLPLELQVRLVFEARRVLAPGGLVVLETPNALSLSTAATNFWVDPTHQRPVHPLFLEFLAREAGFTEVRTTPMHPLPVSFRGSEHAPELVEDLDSLILGSGDLALVASR